MKGFLSWEPDRELAPSQQFLGPSALETRDSSNSSHKFG